MSASATPAGPAALAQGPLKWSGKNGDVDAPVVSVFGAGRELFAIGPRTLRRSSDGAKSWNVIDGAGGNAMWGASIDELWIAGNGVLRSTDHGSTWTRVNAPVTGALQSIGGRASDVYAGGIGVLFHSTDHGATWSMIQHGITDATFFAIATSGSDLFVVGRESVKDPTSTIGYHTESIVLRGTGGAPFVRLDAPKPGMTSNEESRGVCFTGSGKMMLAMSYSVYASDDRGATWTRAVDVGTEVLGLACREREIMVTARNKRFFRSTDAGATWDEHELDGILGPELVSLLSVWIGAAGTALVAGESYAKGTGTLLVRAR